MTIDEASNILKGEQVEVDSAAFSGGHPSGVWIRCTVRFAQSKQGIGGWADILNADRIYVQPVGSTDGGAYVPLELVRRPADPYGPVTDSGDSHRTGPTTWSDPAEGA